MQMRSIGRLLAGLLLAVSMLLAQFDAAEVLGTVRDASGSVVPKATVTLLHQETGIESKAVTDENGNYNFFNVKVGRYTVTVDATGFNQASTENVAVVVN